MTGTAPWTWFARLGLRLVFNNRIRLNTESASWETLGKPEVDSSYYLLAYDLNLIFTRMTKRAEMTCRSEAFAWKLSERKLHRKHTLYPRISPSEKRVKRNQGITAIERTFWQLSWRSVTFIKLKSYCLSPPGKWMQHPSDGVAWRQQGVYSVLHERGIPC
jgi:hypothetical protein